MSQKSINIKEQFHQPRGKLAATLRSATSLGVCLVCMCFAIFASLCGTTLLNTFRTLCRYSPASARMAGRIMGCRGSCLIPCGCWGHPESHSHSLGLSNRPWEQVTLFPPRSLPARLWVFQRRSGMCPKSQEQLSPFLSLFPKGNHLGNPHLFRGSLAACAQQDKTPAGNP